MTTKVRITLTLASAIIVAGGGVAIVTHILGRDTPTPATTTTGSNASQPQKSYIALGDSVAAGVGLQNESDSSACNRTDQSYPHQLASSQNYKLTNLACDRATLAAGIDGPQDVNQLSVTPQLAQLFLQSRSGPDLVTLTIGANDAGWTRFIGACFSGNCNSPEQTAAVKQRLSGLDLGLKQVLKKIQDNYKAKPPHLLVTGYYQVFPATAATCPDVAGVDAGEQQWVRQQLEALNTTIRIAVQGYAFASFVPLNFNGHELCSSDSWVQGISDKQPYHPTADGQADIAKQLSAMLKEK